MIGGGHKISGDRLTSQLHPIRMGAAEFSHRPDFADSFLVPPCGAVEFCRRTLFGGNALDRRFGSQVLL